MCAPTAFRYQKLMEEAVAFLMDHVHEGGIPFTALVVDRNGLVLGRGVNRARGNLDPTAHAEVEAIRNDCRTHGTSSLSGATLIASGEHCAMCYISARFAGIVKVFFAANRNEVAHHGFDYRSSYRLFADDPLHWNAPAVAKLPVSKHLQPFQTFSLLPRAL